MEHRWIYGAALAVALLITAPQARSQIGNQPITHQAALLGAGAVHLSNGTLIVRGTLAQPAIGSLRVGEKAADLGFWHPLSRTTGETRTEDPTTGSGMLALQASPNPFAGATQIVLHIPRNEYVSLVLYNLIGQPVKTLLDNRQTEGEVNVNLVADDLPSGGYTLILTAGDERRTISLLLVR